MNPIVIYTSKYGSTEKYANWIAEALDCPAKKLKDIRPQDLTAYDTILYGGGLYASSISGFKTFLKKLGTAQNKTLILFMVGMANPALKEIYQQTADQNIPSEWKGRFKVFSLRGDLLFSKMSVIHKVMMQVPKSMTLKKPAAERTEDDNQFLEHFGTDVIFTSREQIEPILTYLQQT